MSLLLNKLLSLRKIEYLTVDQDFKILETSLAVQRFADSPHEVVKGQRYSSFFSRIAGNGKCITGNSSRRAREF